MRQIVAFLSIASLLSCSPSPPPFDWQGHRGARGLAPENTLAAFAKALELGVTTLELDLAVSADRQLVVSHEPWFSEVISSHPDGRPVDSTEAEDLRIWQMNYAEIKRFDVGSRLHPRFPEQELTPQAKPLLREVVQLARKFADTHQQPLVNFNIEIKSRPEWDHEFTPPVEQFVELVLEELEQLAITHKVTVQSFDVRALETVHRFAPEVMTAFLVMNTKTAETNLQELSFVPSIYSPYYKMVTEADIDWLHEHNVRVIPWTVNEVEDMRQLKALGVDGIITDYPNRISPVAERD